MTVRSWPPQLCGPARSPASAARGLPRPAHNTNAQTRTEHAADWLFKRLSCVGSTSGAAGWSRARGCFLHADGNDANLNSTMLGSIDRSDPTALHDQVAAQIRRAIAEGEARPGERLPPAQDLAAAMGVNTNTVLRAMRALRDEGLLEFRRGHGIRVTGTPQRSAVAARARDLVAFAREHGYRPDELITIIQGMR